MITELILKIQSEIEGGRMSALSFDTLDLLLSEIKILQFNRLMESVTIAEEIDAFMQLLDKLSPALHSAVAIEKLANAVSILVFVDYYCSMNTHRILMFTEKLHEYIATLEKFQRSFLRADEHAMIRFYLSYAINGLKAFLFLSASEHEIRENIFSLTENILPSIENSPNFLLAPFLDFLKKLRFSLSTLASEDFFSISELLAILSSTANDNIMISFQSNESASDNIYVFCAELYVLSELIHWNNDRNAYLCQQAFSRLEEHANVVKTTKRDSLEFRYALIRTLQHIYEEVKHETIYGLLEVLDEKPEQAPTIYAENSKFLIYLRAIHNFIKEGQSKVQAISGEVIIPVIGFTGAGKSTTIASLMGAKLIPKMIQTKRGMKPTNEFEIDPHQPFQGKLPFIGNKEGESATLYPEIFPDHQHPWYYCDCAGFEHADPEKRAVISLLMESAIKQAGSIKGILIVIDARELVKRAQILLDSMKTLKSIFIDIDLVEDAIVFAITHGGADVNSEEHLETKVDDLYAKYFHKLPQEYQQPFEESLAKKEALKNTEQSLWKSVTQGVQAFKDAAQKLVSGNESVEDLCNRLLMLRLLKKALNTNRVTIFDLNDQDASRTQLHGQLEELRVETDLREVFCFDVYDQYRSRFLEILRTKARELLPALRDEVNRYKGHQEKIQAIQEVLVRISRRETDPFPYWDVSRSGSWRNHITHFTYHGRVHFKGEVSFRDVHKHVYTEADWWDGTACFMGDLAVGSALLFIPVVGPGLGLFYLGAVIMTSITQQGGHGTPISKGLVRQLADWEWWTSGEKVPDQLPPISRVQLQGKKGTFTAHHLINEGIYTETERRGRVPHIHGGGDPGYITKNVYRSTTNLIVTGVPSADQELTEPVSRVNVRYQAPYYPWDAENITVRMYTWTCYLPGNQAEIQRLTAKLEGLSKQEIDSDVHELMPEEELERQINAALIQKNHEFIQLVYGIFSKLSILQVADPIYELMQLWRSIFLSKNTYIDILQVQPFAALGFDSEQGDSSHFARNSVSLFSETDERNHSRGSSHILRK